MKNRKMVIGMLLALLISIGLLAACGRADEPAPAPVDPAAPATPAPPAAATPAPAPEQPAPGEEVVLITRVTADMRGWIPNHMVDDPGFGIHQNMYHRLIQLDMSHSVIPQLSHTWTVSEDGLTITFYLRDDVYWHDGVQVTSADVQYTFLTIRDNLSYVRSPELQVIDDITTPDDFTAVFHLTHPDVGLIGTLAWYGVFVLPQHVLDVGVPWGENPLNTEGGMIGSGPFMYDWQQIGVGTSIIANPNYADGRPRIDRIFYQIIPDMATAVEALIAGDIDHLAGVAPADRERLLAMPGIDIHEWVFPSPHRVHMRIDREPFDDVNVRRALAMTLPRQDMSERIFLGLNPPEYTMYPSVVEWVACFDSLAPTQDIQGARDLLAASGYVEDADGFFIRDVEFMVFSTGLWPDQGRMIEAAAREGGIELVLNIVDSAAWSDQVGVARDYQIAMQGGYMGPDPTAMNAIVGTGGSRNHMGFSCEQVDYYLMRAGSVGDLEERAYWYRKVWARLAEELVHIPTVQSISFEATTSRLRNRPIEGTGRWGWASWAFAYFAD